MKEWIFNEKEHDGVTYSNEKIASEYDENHNSFRDYEEEAKAVIKAISLSSESKVIDFAAGTGALTIELAKYCNSVHAVDISKEMLTQLQNSADNSNLKNISVENAGFLSFEKPSKLFDADS